MAFPQSFVRCSVRSQYLIAVSGLGIVRFQAIRFGARA